MRSGRQRRTPLLDSGVTPAIAQVYSSARGIQSVRLPSLPLAVHYSKTRIGLLTALSVLTHLAARLGTAGAMRRVADRSPGPS